MFSVNMFNILNLESEVINNYINKLPSVRLKNYHYIRMEKRLYCNVGLYKLSSCVI